MLAAAVGEAIAHDWSKMHNFYFGTRNCQLTYMSCNGPWLVRLSLLLCCECCAAGHVGITTRRPKLFHSQSHAPKQIQQLLALSICSMHICCLPRCLECCLYHSRQCALQSICVVSFARDLHALISVGSHPLLSSIKVITRNWTSPRFFSVYFSSGKHWARMGHRSLV